MLDRRLSELVGNRWSSLHADVRDVLRIGAYQIVQLTRVPPHAAVHTSVEVAKHHAGSRSAGLVNAVLRNMLRQESLHDAEPRDLAARYSHPGWLVDRWIARLGIERTESLLRHNNAQPPLVVQPIRTSSDALRTRLESAGCAVRPAPFEAGLEIAARGGSIRALPGYPEGAFIVQDPAQAVLLAHAAIPEGATVWDPCAAPGGKAVQLSLAHRVLASDASARRMARLRDTVTRTRADVFLMRADARFAPIAPGAVDAVVVDAPCSATGTMARHPDARWRLSPARIARQVERQREILDGVASAVRAGGYLAYLTCSLEPEENEEQVNAFLGRHPEFERHADDINVFPAAAGTDGGYAAWLRRER